MFYDKDFIAAKLRRWDKYMRDYTLPGWDELPVIELYMDQVIALLKRYLDFLPHDEFDEKVVTPSAINNYVRIKIMPAPYKKRYSRVHLAYLIMICTLKQSLPIACVQKMIPVDLSEDELKVIYSEYVRRHNESVLSFIGQVKEQAQHVLDSTDTTENAVSNLVSWAAIMASFSKLLAEKIIKLQNVNIPAEELHEVENVSVPPEISKKRRK